MVVLCFFYIKLFFRRFQNSLKNQRLFIIQRFPVHFFRCAACWRTGGYHIKVPTEIFFAELPVLQYEYQVFHINNSSIVKAKSQGFFYKIHIKYPIQSDA